MAKGKGSNDFDAFDTPYQVQPVAGSAEPNIVYGGVTKITSANDPMGVLPEDAKTSKKGE